MSRMSTKNLSQLKIFACGRLGVSR